MADTINTLFEQLLEYRWKDVPFPTSSFKMALRHDLAQHKYGDQDGAFIEATGREPFHFSATIPFLNGAVPGKGETWGVLYPTGYRAFMAVAMKGATGELVHPEFGAIQCKLEHCETTWSAEKRDGVVVEAVWLETLTPNTGSPVLDTSSPIANVLLGALDLDAQIASFTPPLPALPEYQPDFAALMRSIAAISDQVSLTSQRGAGLVSRALYRLDLVERSVEGLSGTFSKNGTAQARNALAWPMRATIEGIRSSLLDLAETLGTTGRALVLYVVPRDATLASVAQDVGAPLGDVVVLNPRQLASPIVARGTVIRYYRAA